MTIHWKAVEQYFTVVLFVFLSYPVCNFGKFISYGLNTVRSEIVERLSLVIILQPIEHVLDLSRNHNAELSSFPHCAPLLGCRRETGFFFL